MNAMKVEKIVSNPKKANAKDLMTLVKESPRFHYLLAYLNTTRVDKSFYVSILSRNPKALQYISHYVIDYEELARIAITQDKEAQFGYYYYYMTEKGKLKEKVNLAYLSKDMVHYQEIVQLAIEQDQSNMRYLDPTQDWFLEYVKGILVNHPNAIEYLEELDLDPDVFTMLHNFSRSNMYELDEDLLKVELGKLDIGSIDPKKYTMDGYCELVKRDIMAHPDHKLQDMRLVLYQGMVYYTYLTKQLIDEGMVRDFRDIVATCSQQKGKQYEELVYYAARRGCANIVANFTDYNSPRYRDIMEEALYYHPVEILDLPNEHPDFIKLASTALARLPKVYSFDHVEVIKAEIQKKIGKLKFASMLSDFMNNRTMGNKNNRDMELKDARKDVVADNNSRYSDKSAYISKREASLTKGEEVRKQEKFQDDIQEELEDTEEELEISTEKIWDPKSKSYKYPWEM